MERIPKSTLRKQLHQRLTQGPIIVSPGIYDAFGARLVEMAGFEAAYMTGNGVSACLLGRADVGLIDLTMMVAHARRTAMAVDIPLICDADTGYGNAVNVRRTVEEFEAAGVAAIHLEDQVMPKRCGHLPGARAVVPLREHAGKIEAACAARTDPNFIIIARTDAASGFGLKEAIKRGQAYRKAGADVIFVELKSSPTIHEDLKRVVEEIDAPCLVNVEEYGKLGELTVKELEKLGFRIAIFPGVARYAAGFAIRETLAILKQEGSTKQARMRMLTAGEYHKVLKLQELEEWEERYQPTTED